METKALCMALEVFSEGPLFKEYYNIETQKK